MGKEQEVVEVVKVPQYQEMFGSLEGAVEEFSPTDLFDRYDIPEDRRYTFKLKPLTAKDKYQIEAQLSTIGLQATLWAKKQGLELDGSGVDNALLVKKIQSLDDKEARFKVIRKYVVDLDNYRDPKGTAVAFKTEKNKDFIHSSIWDMLPTKVKEAVYQRVLDISSLTLEEVASL